MIGAIVSGYYIFKDMCPDENFKNIAGMLVGVYTGGTPNLAALKIMLNVNDNTYLIINSFDMIISFAYITFLLAFGIKMFRWILPYKMREVPIRHPHGDKGVLAESNKRYQENNYSDIFTKKNFIPTLESIALSAGIVGVSIGISFLISGSINMIILILSLTTLASIASFFERVRNAQKSYDAGMYIIFVFSLVIASMVNIRDINFTDGLWILAYISYAVFGSLCIQVILAKIFKIDSDTTIITSVALINSPLFIPLIADRMKNKKVVIIGITIGVIGYAIGNYLGVLMTVVL
jgi:uncharacterized membrane protein